MSFVGEKLVSEPFLIGSYDAVSTEASKTGIKLDGIKSIDPKKSERLGSFAESYFFVSPVQELPFADNGY